MKMIKPFKTKFLSEFVLAPEALPFTNDDVKKLDKELSLYEQVLLDPDIEKSLIKQNELLASFAISKAEGSKLTIDEAKDVYELVLEAPGLDFIKQKVEQKEKLSEKDYEKLEFFNIAKTFRALNQSPFTLETLSGKRIREIHYSLTQGMDIFVDHLPAFTVYRSGKFRDNNEIRVGDYAPAPFNEIKKGVKELASWLRNDFTIENIGIFHTALYALHPFNNGNKRICRVLEHLLLRGLGLNSKNLYSTSYYYHKQRSRYYKYLLASCERKNLNHFTSFFLESIVMSIIGVVKTSIESQRRKFIRRSVSDKELRLVLKPLAKRKELQFKYLYKRVKNKMARQTFVSHLKNGVEQGFLVRRAEGRKAFYTLAIEIQEESQLRDWVSFAKKRLRYIPTEFELV